MSEEYLRQMREIERQEDHLKSQYTNEDKLDPNNYRHIVNAEHIDYAPRKGETWESFSDRLAIYVKIGNKLNYDTHIDGPNKAWYTHRGAGPCFMCNDTNMINVLRRVIGLMTIQYPKNIF